MSAQAVGFKPAGSEPLADRGVTIHGGQWGDLEQVSEKVSAVGLNSLFLHGDVINFFKFTSPVFSWLPSINVPGFDLFNGVSGTVAGTVVTSSGVKAAREGKGTGDRAGIIDGAMTVEIGMTMVASAVAKLGYAALGIVNFFRVLPAALVPLIGALGVINGIFTVFMFIGFAARSVFREKEIHAFRDEFRATLLEILPWIELSEKGSPEELFKEAAEKSNVDEEELAEWMLVEMQGKMPVDTEHARVEGEIRRKCEELMQPVILKDRFFNLASREGIIKKEVPQMLDGAEKEFKSLRALYEGDGESIAVIEEKLDHIATLREKWNEHAGKVNYEKRVGRATKDDIVAEIRLGRPLDEKHGTDPRAVITHLSEKWVERRNWNRYLGALAVVAVGLVIFLMVATSGPIAIVASGLIVTLFVAMALFFDGPGIIGELKSKKVGKWDGAIGVAQTALLVGIMTGVIAATIATGGVFPIAYCLVVGVMLLIIQLVYLGWTAKRLAEKRLEGDDLGHRKGVVASINGVLADVGEDFLIEEKGIRPTLEPA